VFSRRTPWNEEINPLTRALSARKTAGLPLFDLTGSNPTVAGFDYPLEELSEALARAARAPYTPHPRGLPAARSALAEALSSSGDEVSPDDLVLTASTSEAYSFLFKLLCDPGDSVAVGIPGYPLLDHLAALEGISLKRFRLEQQARWELHVPELARACDASTRAVVVVNPNNPTGSYVDGSELAAVSEFAGSAGLALISDEVFFDYPLTGTPRSVPAASLPSAGLTFSLGGLSKSAGLPHWKLGWIRVGGPPAARRAALEALELIADTFLSVSTPVQEALPGVLRLAPAIRAQIAARIRRNYEAMSALLSPSPGATLLPAEGGWSAVIRLPRFDPDETTALRLLEEKGVAVYPGYFFDFPSDGYFVVSLLTPSGAFDEGVQRIAEFVRATPPRTPPSPEQSRADFH
jgi:alanine-synthesizing transaminase